MARALTEWEARQKREEQEAAVAEGAKRKEVFIKKCLDAKFSQEQAEILWGIFSIASAPGPIPLEHMTF